MKTIINKTSIFFQSIITVCIFSAFGIAQNTISIEVGDGTIDVLYNSNAEIGGFQFTVEGATVTGTSGGDAAANGFTVTCNSTLCLGFSFSGAIIPPGSGTLVIVSADITGDVSLTGIVFSDAAGNALDFTFDSGSEEPDYIVEVSNYAFTPDHLDIAAGETVEWVNLVGFHNVDGSTDTYPDNPESFYNGSASSDLWSYSFTFTVAGNYDYECTPHAPSMAGTITVGSGGCTDDMACNYDAGADFDDGSCLNNDCAGVCGGSAEVDECGVCGGDGTSCGDDHIDLSFGAIADGNMEILMTNTMAISGFQFNITGVDLDGASGGRAADAGFSVSTGVEGVVLGFSFTGAEIPAGSGVLTNLSFSALSDEACITNEVLALGEWSGGFYAINIGDCAALDYSAPSSTADVLYNSDSDIAGFQFHVDGDVTVTGVSGGAAGAAGFTVSTGNNNVLGFSLTGSVVPAGAGTLITLEYTGDGSPCLSDLILSDSDANGLDATIEDCLTISYEAPCDDADADGICDELEIEGHFENKTKFQYTQKDIRRILKIAIENLKDKINEKLKEGKEFRIWGDRSIYFNGNHYSLHILKDGRVAAFHPMENPAA